MAYGHGQISQVQVGPRGVRGAYRGATRAVSLVKRGGSAVPQVSAGFVANSRPLLGVVPRGGVGRTLWNAVPELAGVSSVGAAVSGVAQRAMAGVVLVGLNDGEWPGAPRFGRPANSPGGDIPVGLQIVVFTLAGLVLTGAGIAAYRAARRAKAAQAPTPADVTATAAQLTRGLETEAEAAAKRSDHVTGA
ncbi:MAG: hypothetical protein HY696_02540 [Deltaproteobacteria bacterium]|nr:hypothetical protein [Deltaproteobacteria bacterium]